MGIQCHDETVSADQIGINESREYILCLYKSEKKEKNRKFIRISLAFSNLYGNIHM